jgi:hypothetical protein
MWNTSTALTKRKSATALAVGLTLVAILLIGAAPGRAATNGTTYDNVQVMIHTTNSTFTGTYSVTVYNSSGSQLVTYQTPYPAASFELPAGSYIIGVSANSQYQYACPLGVGAGTATGSSAPPVSAATASSGSSSGKAIILPPCYLGNTQSEYGFAVQQVSGPTSLVITTQPVQSFPTTTVTVHVHYANGTAAAGTQLYASVLGGNFFFGCNVCAGSTSTLSMSGVTGSDGTATLTVPAVPLVVTGWNWVPIYLPVSQSTVQVSVGGEKVNVTVNWEPSYVGLAGSVLIVPPQTSGSIVLHIQQPKYWATPAGASTASTEMAAGSASSPATVSSGPGLVPASLTPQQSGTQTAVQTVVSTSVVTEQAPAGGSNSPAISTGSSGYDTVLLTIIGALALAVASASLIIVRRRPARIESHA